MEIGNNKHKNGGGGGDTYRYNIYSQYTKINNKMKQVKKLKLRQQVTKEK